MLTTLWNSGGYVPAPASASVTWQGTSPTDPFWYESVMSASDTGVYISADRIFQCGTVLAAVRFLAQSVAMCTPQVFRKTADGREPAPDHYLEAALRRPCAWMTGYRWRAQQMTWAATYGNAYCRLVSMGNPVDELRPLHPQRVRVTDQLEDGRIAYEYQPPQGRPVPYMQDQLVHFRGLSSDGIEGMSMYRMISQAVGIALAAEKHAAVFLRKGVRPSGILSAPGVLQKDVRERLDSTMSKAHAGADNVGKTMLLEAGITYTSVSMDHEAAQFIENRDFQVGDILRFLGVPGVVVGYADKTATYASAKEFFESGGIKHCILPWLMNLEAEINDACIAPGDPHFVRFNLDVLMRASLRDRYDAHSKAVGRPWMTANEVRKIEDLPPDDDPASDQIATAKAPAAPGGAPLERPHDTPEQGLP